MEDLDYDENGDPIMTDADFERALDALREQDQNGEVGELLIIHKIGELEEMAVRIFPEAMNENRIISWEEAERILGDTGHAPVKSSLPEQTRPSEPDNDTDVDTSIRQLQSNDPKLKQINLNNMKRTPIPQLQRLIAALAENTTLEKLSLANMGLYDTNVEPLIEAVENNESLRVINLETNYISGDFFARLFKAALKNQTLEEVKAVNQGVSFSTTAEKEIIDAIYENRGLIKVSINLRLPEGRYKVEQATLRNGEIRRVLRRQAAEASKQAEEDKKKAEAEAAKAAAAAPKPAVKKTAVTDKAATAPKTTTTAAVAKKPAATATTTDEKKPTATEETGTSAAPKTVKKKPAATAAQAAGDDAAAAAAPKPKAKAKPKPAAAAVPAEDKDDPMTVYKMKKRGSET